MLTFLVLLITVIEILLAVFVVLTLANASNEVRKTNQEINSTKNLVVPAILNARVQFKLLNIQSKELKYGFQIEQILSLINTAGLASLFFKKNKKK